jgi:hypothetical protein
MHNPRDYTFFEWIQLWNEAHRSDSDSTPMLPTIPQLPIFPAYPYPDYSRRYTDTSINGKYQTITSDRTTYTGDNHHE